MLVLYDSGRSSRKCTILSEQQRTQRGEQKKTLRTLNVSRKRTKNWSCRWLICHINTNLHKDTCSATSRPAKHLKTSCVWLRLASIPSFSVITAAPVQTGTISHSLKFETVLSLLKNKSWKLRPSCKNRVWRLKYYTYTTRWNQQFRLQNSTLSFLFQDRHFEIKLFTVLIK